jgi:hypothetical protein
LRADGWRLGRSASSTPIQMLTSAAATPFLSNSSGQSCLLSSFFPVRSGRAAGLPELTQSADPDSEEASLGCPAPGLGKLLASSMQALGGGPFPGGEAAEVGPATSPKG